ncbi:chitobiase/beta-hexosaminidase C-terminal domain-containing protein [Lunatibacter salilacus]|uniref:chitobiase/beta-hexosaminidase C-terminal domain-containing protein n=1 Tax=Lunatibacter salilacus TaxID=2483804 RepID=UPI00131B203E|nr:chitobiase/beta-hexosaminidase C-terminal domain-containing protein [Lunatibacter salilacus]
MKNILIKSIFLALSIVLSMVPSHAQNREIAGWTFGELVGEESQFANRGNFNNIGVREISLTNADLNEYVGGFSGRSITSNRWVDEELEKFWVIQVNTLGFENLNLSSKQRSSDSGPRDFKAEYSLDGTFWEDIPGGIITVANDFTSGTLNKISLPQDANNQTLIFIRWINTSNISVSGGTISSAGTSRIDEIFIEGEVLGGALEPTASPVINPDGGIFEEAQTVTLTSETPGSTIYYTLDGSAPNLGSTLYSTPIVIEESAILFAIAVAEGFNFSETSTAQFTIEMPGIPSSSIPYNQNFGDFVNLSSPVTSFGVNDEWSFEGSALNYNGLFSSGTSAGLRGGDVMGYQHTGSSGVFTASLELENDTNFPITDLEISYVGKVARLDQTRFPEWTVSVNGSLIPELAYSTSTGEDMQVSASLSELNIQPGEFLNISWSSDRGFNASGGSRQIGLTNVRIEIPEVLEPVDFVNWDFTTQPGNQLSTPGVSLQPGVEARDFARGSDINPASARNSISSNGWNEGDNRYYTFGFNVALDKLIDLTSLQIGSTSSGTGPRDLALVYSGDNFTSRLAEWQHTGSFVNQILDLSGLLNLSGNIEFRIIRTSDIAANGSTIGSGGTMRITNFFPGPLPVTFTGIIKDADGVIIPAITTNPSQLDFGAVSLAALAPILSYELTGENLEGPVNVSAPAPYGVSKDGIDFAGSIEFSIEELSDSQTVFVRFENAETGNFSTVISNQTSSSLPLSVSLTGSVFDPFSISENFNTTCPDLASGWEAISVTGEQQWACTTFGRAGTNPTASSPFGIQINGFFEGPVLNEDWLITAPYNLNDYNIPLLTFWSRVAFQGPRLRLLISTDYENGNPNESSWKELSDRFASGDEWTFSGQLDLSEYLNQTVRFAFVYNSSPETGAARWTLDDFTLFSSELPAEPFFSTTIGNLDYLHFGIVPIGGISSTTQSFSFNLSNPSSNLTISAEEGFEFSKDGVVYQSTLIYTPSELTGLQSVLVRFAPTSEGAFASPIRFESGDIIVSRGYLTGATVEIDQTFDVVNWNIEWFGSTESGQGPTNVDLQLENVRTIIANLDADVYAFQEITSLSKFNELAESLPEYGMAVSPAASAGGEYAEEAQKLTYLFKLATVDTIQTKALLTGVEPSMLTDYPSTPDRFWASGRLPFLMDIITTINGVRQNVTLVNLHTRSNGGGESATNPRYAMRRYDVNVLKDSLDTYYGDVPLIILGDFNDDLDETVADQTAATVGTSETSFINYINDPERYVPITISLSNEGLRTFPSFENVIDHQIISDELEESWIVNSERIVAPYDLIANFDNTTSDHLPVKSRFILKCDLELPQLIASETEVCAGSNSVEFQLFGGVFDTIVGWEISLDNGSNWTLIEESQNLNSISVSDLEFTALVRAIIDSDNCGPVATEAVEISLKTLPTPVIGFERGRLFTLEGPYTYQWYKNGILIANTTINSTEIRGAGNYTVMITDEAGCMAVSGPFSFPLRRNSNIVKLYPNPAANYVFVQLRKFEGMHQVELRTFTGALIESKRSEGALVFFNVSKLSAGVYLIYVTDRDGSTSVERLMVR